MTSQMVAASCKQQGRDVTIHKNYNSTKFSFSDSYFSSIAELVEGTVVVVAVMTPSLDCEMSTYCDACLFTSGRRGGRRSGNDLFLTLSNAYGHPCKLYKIACNTMIVFAMRNNNTYKFFCNVCQPVVFLILGSFPVTNSGAVNRRAQVAPLARICKKNIKQMCKG